MNDNTVFTLLSGVTGTSTGSSFGCASLGACVHIFSASTSSCTVLIQGSLDGTNWNTLVTLTNPDSGGYVYQGSAMPYMRAKVSAHASGTITAKMTALSHDPGPWASITEPTNSVGAISCTSLMDSGLTATRVPFAGTGGLLDDDPAMTWDDTLKALSVTYAKANWVSVASAKASNGAVSAVPQTIFITKGTALGSSTVANPTATDHDGYVITFISATAAAHVVSFNSGKVNGGSNTTVTLGGAIGDGFQIVAYQGVWYTTWLVNATVT